MTCLCKKKRSSNHS